jgi:hypothetical protein
VNAVFLHCFTDRIFTTLFSARIAANTKDLNNERKKHRVGVPAIKQVRHFVYQNSNVS